MKTEVLVPHLPESVSDATLIAWHKNAGDTVEKDENLIDLETDKVVLEVPAPQSGILEKILQKDGATVTSGNLLAVITTVNNHSATEQAAEPEKTENESSAKNPALSPAVRRLVVEHKLNPEAIDGSGKDGRLTKSDVLNFIKDNATTPVATPDADKPAAKVPSANLAPPAALRSSDGRQEQRVPMTRLRARVAERLIQAQQNAAMLTTFNEVNLSRIIELRREYQEDFVKRHEVKLGFMSFFIKASVEALVRFPVINASVDNQDIIYHSYYDIGVAVSSDRGLVVPVLRDVDGMEFASIEKQIADFGNKAKQGKLSIDDLSGGTFTITNGGTFGSMMSTPILNPPQSAILGMHNIQERAVVEKGNIVARPMMYLALSYDHRIIDGRDAVQFLVSIKESLEDPSRLLLNL